MTTFTVTLPWPSPMLSPNKTGHWKPRWQAQQAANYDGRLAAVEGMQAGGLGVEWWREVVAGKPLALAVTFYPPNKRRRDRDNAQASLKHQFDGIAAALGVDDHVFQPTYAWGDVRPPGCVVVEVAAIAEVAA